MQVRRLRARLSGDLRGVSYPRQSRLRRSTLPWWSAGPPKPARA